MLNDEDEIDIAVEALNAFRSISKDDERTARNVGIDDLLAEEFETESLTDLAPPHDDEAEIDLTHDENNLLGDHTIQRIHFIEADSDSDAEYEDSSHEDEVGNTHDSIDKEEHEAEAEESIQKDEVKSTGSDTKVEDHETEEKESVLEIEDELVDKDNKVEEYESEGQPDEDTTENVEDNPPENDQGVNIISDSSEEDKNVGDQIIAQLNSDDEDGETDDLIKNIQISMDDEQDEDDDTENNDNNDITQTSQNSSNEGDKVGEEYDDEFYEIVSIEYSIDDDSSDDADNEQTQFAYDLDDEFSNENEVESDSEPVVVILDTVFENDENEPEIDIAKKKNKTIRSPNKIKSLRKNFTFKKK